MSGNDEPVSQGPIDHHATFPGMPGVPGMPVVASVVLRDRHGGLVVLDPGHRPGLDLPGGTAEPGEAPHEAARRAVREVLALDLTVGRLLAVCTSRAGASGRVVLDFLFDGPTLTDEQVAALVPVAAGSHAVYVLTPDQALPRFAGRTRRRVSVALEAYASGACLYVVDGREYRPAKERVWHEDEPIPAGAPVLRAAGWLFDPEGRVLLVGDPDGGYALPGGGAEPEDVDALATLTREVAEEANAVLGKTTHVGYLSDPDGGDVRSRSAARIASLGPLAPDPATGWSWSRALVTPRRAAALLSGGYDARLPQALAAQRIAHERLGVPILDDDSRVDVPPEGVTFE
ncbi:NUDIX hydrolase [Embleya sp. NBC_00888]|uniref:NUDIX hydrolase n=1 Tax=Embleya sp. NBC_00888 TaxID=2975960 RepID=UPI00386A2227|nr:NUDIX hydrolase [Embleya sp. NBC_00888]